MGRKGESSPPMVETSGSYPEWTPSGLLQIFVILKVFFVIFFVFYNFCDIKGYKIFCDIHVV